MNGKAEKRVICSFTHLTIKKRGFLHLSVSEEEGRRIDLCPKLERKDLEW